MLQKKSSYKIFIYTQKYFSPSLRKFCGIPPYLFAAKGKPFNQKYVTLSHGNMKTPQPHSHCGLTPDSIFKRTGLMKLLLFTFARKRVLMYHNVRTFSYRYRRCPFLQSVHTMMRSVGQYCK